MVYQSYDTQEKIGVCKIYEKGFSSCWIEQNLGIPGRNVLRWWKKYSNGESLEPSKITGRKRKLDETDILAVKNELDRNPSASNKRLAQLVGDKVVPQTITNYLKREDVPYTFKNYSDDEPNCFKPETVKNSLKFLKFIESIPMNQRVYQR
jgi:transposase